MINNFYYKGKLIVRIERNPKCRREKICIFDDETYILFSEVDEVEFKCDSCNSLVLTKFNYYNLNNKIRCLRCRSLGENNPFFGKKHDSKIIEKIKNKKRLYGKDNPMFGKSIYNIWIEKYGVEEANKKIKNHKQKLVQASSGENNHFYGKNHSEETKIKLSYSSKKTYENYSNEEKERIRQTFIRSHEKQKKENYQKYIEDKKRAGLVASNNPKKYKKNKIEKKVEYELKKRNLDFEYSIIICNKQFDFGNKQYRIFLEVHGDYWHGNPKIYNELNDIQKNNIEKDKNKKEICEKYKIKIFIIWEQDIKNNNFSVLDEIEKYINEIRTNSNQKN